MSFEDLPIELLYDITGHAVAAYIDRAVASPPMPSYVFSFSEEILNAAHVIATNERKKNGSFMPVTIGSDRTPWSYISKEEFYQALEVLAKLGYTPAEVSVKEDSGRGDARSSDNGNVGDLNGFDYGVTWDLQEDYLIPYRTPAWESSESREKLPGSTIQSLLGVNRTIRAVTFEVVFNALGLAPLQSDESILSRINHLLRDLRKCFRLAYTKPRNFFELDFSPDRSYTSGGLEVPLISSYLFIPRYMYAIHYLRGPDAEAVRTPDGIRSWLNTFHMDLHKVKDSFSINHIPSALSDIILERLSILGKRAILYMNVKSVILENGWPEDDFRYQVQSVRGFAMTGSTTVPTVEGVLEFCGRADQLLKQLIALDNTEQENVYYSVLPASLAKDIAFLNPSYLLWIYALRSGNLIAENEVVKSVVESASKLINSKYRYDRSKTDFVVFSLPPQARQAELQLSESARKELDVWIESCRQRDLLGYNMMYLLQEHIGQS